MTTIYSLPNVEITHLVDIVEERPIALLAGERAWRAVNSLLSLPIVVQANPERLEADYLDGLAADLPPEVEAVYGIGGGMVADAAKYIASRRGLPAVVMPTALSVDGFFTPIVAMRGGGSVSYVETGPAERIYIDWDVIRTAPQHYRGAAIVELLTIVTGLLDWKYAAEHNKNTADMRYVEWAAKVMAGIAQQAFKIAAGVGRGNVEALRNLLDLMCLEVQITNQLGHTRPQEGSEQYFAYALEPRMVTPYDVCRYGRAGHSHLRRPTQSGRLVDPLHTGIGGHSPQPTDGTGHPRHHQHPAELRTQAQPAVQHFERSRPHLGTRRRNSGADRAGQIELSPLTLSPPVVWAVNSSHRRESTHPV
ncbi:MAG: iron-containing alcohol dehydrogenase [Chloroflexi bacterium]|nr:iron-containing alcohol dehydrogenase [Chloroflexota bacterium]